MRVGVRLGASDCSDDERKGKGKKKKDRGNCHNVDRIAGSLFCVAEPEPDWSSTLPSTGET